MRRRFDASASRAADGGRFPSPALLFRSPVESSPPPTPTALTTFLPSSSRLVAIGDLHGDLPKSLSALRLAGLVPASTGSDSLSTATS